MAHTHPPLKQDLIVTGVCGLAQRWDEDGPVKEIRPSDVVWIPPGERHWHGATATTAMTSISIQEQLDGETADWMEKVSDEQCHAWSSGKRQAIRLGDPPLLHTHSVMGK